MSTPVKPPVCTDDETPRRRLRWLIAFLLLFLIGGIVWAVRPNPHLARAQELQKKLFSADAKSLPADQRKALFDEYRTEMKQLTDDQKAKLFEPMHQKQMAEFDRYFAMTPQEKVRYLDERIDRSEKAKKDRQQKPGGQPGGGFAGGPPGGGFGGGPPGGGFGGPQGGGKGGGPPSAEEIEKRKKQALDRTTPEERAKMDQFRRDMDSRRRQRGLPVTSR